MSVLENMQGLVGSAKPHLTTTCRKLEALVPKLGMVHYSLRTLDRELQVQILHGYKGEEIGHFSMSFYPGCRDVMVFHRVAVEPTLRNLGVGSLLHSLRLNIARAAGVRLVTCTVLTGNSAEKSIISKFGWRVQTSINPQVEMWYKELES